MPRVCALYMDTGALLRLNSLQRGGAADKTSNLRTIASSPAAGWSVKRRLEYIAWAKNVVAGLRGTSSWLEEQFDVAVTQAEQSINPPLAGV